MTKKYIKAIRKKLPAHYANKLADKFESINRDQVIRVFSGEITNPEIVTPVMEAAISYIKELKESEIKISEALAQL